MFRMLSPFGIGSIYNIGQHGILTYFVQYLTVSVYKCLERFVLDFHYLYQEQGDWTSKNKSCKIKTVFLFCFRLSIPNFIYLIEKDVVTKARQETIKF
jgi:hypothetical protein